MNYDMFVNSPSDAEESTEHNLDEIYEKIDDLEGRISDMQLLQNRTNSKILTNQNEEAAATPTDVYLASITDAVGDIKDNTFNGYTWIVILSFIIVIFEAKKMIRGAIKSWYDRR